MQRGGLVICIRNTILKGLICVCVPHIYETGVEAIPDLSHPFIDNLHTHVPKHMATNILEVILTHVGQNIQENATPLISGDV